ncbi:MAG: 3'-5' exonuclease [Cryomorphaceae bacterium]|nr:3'-5' exonuclease [Cryomorphaceae bacterium]
MLSLHRPLVIFDLETTGVQVTKDRIVEMGAIKVHPDGKEEAKRWLINPGMVIPDEVIKIHGITNEMVKDAPTFKEVGGEIINWIGNSDLGGYNCNKFDVPLFVEECLRNDYDFDLEKRKVVDVQNIFHRMEQRTLAAAYKFYCDKSLENAHSAEADSMATWEVLKAQVDRYNELEDNVDFLSEFSNRQKIADVAGFIAYNKNDQEIFTFGKYRNQTVVSVLEKDPGYYGWILQADFPLYTKKILTKIKLKMAGF